jgi:hypothetical protein
METKFKELKGVIWYEITEKEARHIWENVTQLEIYRLFDDGSEALIEDDEDFHKALIDGSTLAVEAKYRENF